MVVKKKQSKSEIRRLATQKIKGELRRAPWNSTSAMRKMIPPRRIPITSPEQIIPIAKATLEKFKALPAWMHPNDTRFGKSDIQEFWVSLVQQFNILRKAIEELEKR